MTHENLLTSYTLPIWSKNTNKGCLDSAWIASQMIQATPSTFPHTGIFPNLDPWNPIPIVPDTRSPPASPRPPSPPWPIVLFLQTLLHPWPYTTHKFHEFIPGRRTHPTHIHALQHTFFCNEVKRGISCIYHSPIYVRDWSHVHHLLGWVAHLHTLLSNARTASHSPACIPFPWAHASNVHPRPLPIYPAYLT